MQKIIGLLVILAGAFLAFRMLVRGWLLLLLLGVLAAVAALTGLLGRWGYGVALFFLLLAIPGFMFGSLAMLLRLAPLLLVLYILYRLAKAFK